MPKQGAALSRARMTVTVALADPIRSLILNFPCWLRKSKWIVSVGVRHWLCSTTRGKTIAVANEWRRGDTSGQVKPRRDRPCDHISADGSRCVQGNWLSRVCGGCLLLAPRNPQREGTMIGQTWGAWMEKMPQQLMEGTYSLWKPGEFSPASVTLETEGNWEAAWGDPCCQLSKWKQKADFSAVACVLGVQPPAHPIEPEYVCPERADKTSTRESVLPITNMPLRACTFSYQTPVKSSTVIQRSKRYLWLLNLDQS